MDYKSAKETAEEWGISQRRVSILCAEQRIPYVTKMGNMWLIPQDAKKPKDKRSIKRSKASRAKPFVKWAGGKGQLLNEIKKHYPLGLGYTYTKYAEPFVGGGAVLFDVLNTYLLEEIYISDTNAELINTYKVLRDDVEILIESLQQYQLEYLPLDEDARKVYFYEKRKRYNFLKKQDVLNEEMAALFIFLNRTCFNGLYRVNSKDEFNTPIGSYKSPLICDSDNLLQVSALLRDITIFHGDYNEAEHFIDDRTFAYFDPPYRPLNATSNFTSYTQSAFNDDSQKELAELIQKLNKKGAYVIASNSDPKNVDEEDEFFDELYKGLKIKRISANRMINSNANSRGKISELLIVSS